jgi:hypothetical protein
MPTIPTFEESQTPNSTATPKFDVEGVHPTGGWSRSVDRASIIGAEKTAGGRVVSQDHQAAPFT